MCYTIVNDTLEYMAHFKGFYGIEEIVGAIGIYLHSSIEDNLYSHDFFIRALAIMDRRCGKRTLKELANSNCIFNAPNWLIQFYCLRFEVEGINYYQNFKIN